MRIQAINNAWVCVIDNNTHPTMINPDYKMIKNKNKMINSYQYSSDQKWVKPWMRINRSLLPRHPVSESLPSRRKREPAIFCRVIDCLSKWRYSRHVLGDNNADHAVCIKPEFWLHIALFNENSSSTQVLYIYARTGHYVLIESFTRRSFGLYVRGFTPDLLTWCTHARSCANFKCEQWHCHWFRGVKMRFCEVCDQPCQKYIHDIFSITNLY